MSQNQKITYGPFTRQSAKTRGQACNNKSSSQLASAQTIDQPEQSVTEPEHIIADPDPELLAQDAQIPISNIQVDEMADISLSSLHGNPGDRADLWLVDYTDYCKCKGLNEERARTSFRFFLKDHAKQWYLSLPEATRNNFDNLIQRLKELFNGSDGGCSITTVKQAVGESCSSYFTKFLAATNQKNYPADLLVQFALDRLVD